MTVITTDVSGFVAKWGAPTPGSTMLYVCIQFYMYVKLYHARLGRDVSDLLTRRDVTGLYSIGYYGLHHTAARLLWSLIR